MSAEGRGKPFVAVTDWYLVVAGQKRPVIIRQQQSFRRRLCYESCQSVNSLNWAKAVVGASVMIVTHANTVQKLYYKARYFCMLLDCKLFRSVMRSIAKLAFPTIFSFATILGCMSAAYAIDTYVCYPKGATGFIYNGATNTWEIKRIIPPSSHYSVRPYQPGADFAVWPSNNNESPYMYDPEISTPGELLRFRGFGHFSIDTKTLRYTRTQESGWISDGPGGFPEGSATPWIEIGVCKRQR